MGRCWAAAIVVTILLSGCGGAAPTPTPVRAAATSTQAVPTATPMPTPTPPPPATPTPVTYTVRAGDTLVSIGARFGVPAQAIAQANGITNPDLIRVGQTLVIPLAPAPAVTPSAAR